ncbi:MAG TPA: hypothetical protein VF092_19280 [Longimicrobium sp.]
MYQVLTRALLAAAAATVLAASTLPAQAASATPQVAALNTVMDFRLNWVGDSTKFDACSVYRSVRRPASFPEGLLPAFRVALDRTGQPCVENASAADPRNTVRVRVDSVSVGETAATVNLTVRKGELTYVEEYHLVSTTGGTSWGLNDVKVHRATRTYFVRPGMGPGRPRP